MILYTTSQAVLQILVTVASAKKHGNLPEVDLQVFRGKVNHSINNLHRKVGSAARIFISEILPDSYICDTALTHLNGIIFLERCELSDRKRLLRIRFCESTEHMLFQQYPRSIENSST